MYVSLFTGTSLIWFIAGERLVLLLVVVVVTVDDEAAAAEFEVRVATRNISFSLIPNDDIYV